MTIVNHSTASDRRTRRLPKHAAAVRRAQEEGSADFEATGLSPERLAELEAADQYLTDRRRGWPGQRTSLYEYRITARGGKASN